MEKKILSKNLFQRFSQFLLMSIFISSLFLFNGCAAVDNTMKSWVGSNQSDLIASWGPPSRTASDGKGGTILIYEYYRNMGQSEGRAYVDALGMMHYTNPTQQGYVATRMFYVDENGIIYSYRWQGL